MCAASNTVRDDRSRKNIPRQDAPHHSILNERPQKRGVQLYDETRNEHNTRLSNRDIIPGTTVHRWPGTRLRIRFLFTLRDADPQLSFRQASESGAGLQRQYDRYNNNDKRSPKSIESGWNWSLQGLLHLQREYNRLVRAFCLHRCDESSLETLRNEGYGRNGLQRHRGRAQQLPHPY